MFVAAVIAILVGAVVGGATGLSPLLRIADEAHVAALVGVSGALAGWALVGTVFGAGTDGIDPSDILSAGAGAIVMVALAWRGRRRTFGDLGLTAHSAEQPADAPTHATV
ncbi:MAG: hypothetical protein REI11_03735 [Patulibacter sp.]|nr:hypothetical protein [Patulibacter sp.]